MPSMHSPVPPPLTWTPGPEAKANPAPSVASVKEPTVSTPGKVLVPTSLSRDMDIDGPEGQPHPGQAVQEDVEISEEPFAVSSMFFWVTVFK